MKTLLADVFSWHGGHVVMPALGADEANAMNRLTLAGAVARGDRRALSEVYTLHHEAVRAFARRLTGDDTAAEDLVQEAFVSLPAALASYRGDASLKTFLVGVTVNHARHHVRAAMRRRALLARMADETVPTFAPAPDVAAEQVRLARALTAALDQLPLEQRAAFVLCEVEERTSAEAAAIVSAPEATVRTRLHHAKKKLRAALAGSLAQ